MGELSKLPNIGEVVEKQLNEVGIMTYEKLKEIGSKQAWLDIKSIDDSACIHRLYALEGAIQGIKRSESRIKRILWYSKVINGQFVYGKKYILLGNPDLYEMSEDLK